MKLLSIVGTIAMFMVGGGILIHGIPPAQDFIEHIVQSSNDVPAISGLLEVLTSPLLNAMVGIVSGALAWAGITVVERIYIRFKH
jgi:hypothetical protein